MKIKIEDNKEISALTGLPVMTIVGENDQGAGFTLWTYGAIFYALNMPDQDGLVENIILTHDNLADYVLNANYLNATVGLSAGRIKLGILTRETAKGIVSYPIEVNEGENALHGGAKGLSKKNWNIIDYGADDTRVFVTLSYIHQHLEDDFPGTFEIKMTVTLSSELEMTLVFETVSNEEIYINLAQHNYYNLSGKNDLIDEDLLFINAKKVRLIEDESLPSSESTSVENSPYDFTIPKEISRSFNSPLNGLDNPYDFAVPVDAKKSKVIYYSPKSRRKLSITTNQNCAVIYTTNSGNHYHQGICVETQNYPNEMHWLKAGDIYHHETHYQFSVQEQLLFHEA